MKKARRSMRKRKKKVGLGLGLQNKYEESETKYNGKRRNRLDVCLGLKDMRKFKIARQV